VQSITFSCILLQTRGFPEEKLFFVVAPNIVSIIIAVPPPPIHTERCIISHAPSRKRQIAVSFTGYFGTGGFLLPVGGLGSGGGFCVYGKFVEPCFKDPHFLNSSLNCQEGMFRIQHFRGAHAHPRLSTLGLRRQYVKASAGIFPVLKRTMGQRMTI